MLSIISPAEIEGKISDLRAFETKLEPAINPKFYVT